MVVLASCTMGFLPLVSSCSVNSLVVFRWLGMLYGGL